MMILRRIANLQPRNMVRLGDDGRLWQVDRLEPGEVDGTFVLHLSRTAGDTMALYDLCPDDVIALEP
jgi:hypothetical protein